MSRGGAGERVVRVLTYLPWIAAHDGPAVSEVCERFGISERRLLADLEVLPFIGLPPYTPDVLIEVTVEDGRVWIHYADFFARPLRLTPEEGLALVAAGGVLRDLPGHDPEGPLERGLVKLAGVLGVDPDLVDTGPADPAILETLTEAANGYDVVSLGYYSYGRDDRTEREIEPWRVFHDKGAWYVVGYCHLAEGERVFRLDRIEYARRTGATFEPPMPSDAVGVFDARDDDPRVTLLLQPAARWVLEQYPIESAHDLDDGAIRITMAIAARPWFERLLLRLGPDAQVVDGDDPTLAGAGAEAAARILARYRS